MGFLLDRFSSQPMRLTSAKKQLFNPRLPSIRRSERDEVLCRLSDEHSRHTTTITEGYSLVNNSAGFRCLILFRTISEYRSEERRILHGIFGISKQNESPRGNN